MTEASKLSIRILRAQATRQPLGTLEISEMEARLLAGELAGMRLMANEPDAAEIFDGMVCGRSQFMDVPIKVTPPPAGLAPGSINRVIVTRGCVAPTA